MGTALLVGESVASLCKSPIAQLLNNSIGVKKRGIGYTKGLPPGAPPEAEFTYLAPNIIVTEKVRWFEIASCDRIDLLNRSSSPFNSCRFFRLGALSLASSCSTVASFVRDRRHGFQLALQSWVFWLYYGRSPSSSCFFSTAEAIHPRNGVRWWTL